MLEGLAPNVRLGVAEADRVEVGEGVAERVVSMPVLNCKEGEEEEEDEGVGVMVGDPGALDGGDTPLTVTVAVVEGVSLEPVLLVVPDCEHVIVCD